MFRDRIEAGSLLVEKLRKYQGDPCLILAVPNGGVAVAYEVAKELGFPLEVLLTKKIGHPMIKEYAIGACSLTNEFIVQPSEVSQQYIDDEIERARMELKKTYCKFMGDKEPENLEGKTVIVIDDGMATGNTLLEAINLLKKNKPGKIIIAVPVASVHAVQKLAKEADDLILVLMPESFYGIDTFYENFEKVSDEKVISYLNKLRELRKADQTFPT